MIAAFTNEAVAHNAPSMKWHVLDRNDRAIKFYDRLGAKEDDWLHYGMNETEFRKLAET